VKVKPVSRPHVTTVSRHGRRVKLRGRKPPVAGAVALMEVTGEAEVKEGPQISGGPLGASLEARRGHINSGNVYVKDTNEFLCTRLWHKICNTGSMFILI
jgi:hypothetical protein